VKSRALATQRRAERRGKRRQVRAQKRAAARRPNLPRTEDEKLIARFAEAYIRWNAHRGDELQEPCPICGRRVVITPRVAEGEEHGKFDASHIEPACGMFVMLLMGMGAGDLRTTTRNVA